jgi:Tfp pilus assembly protein PilN
VRAVNLIPAEQRVHTGGLANRSEGVAHIVLGTIAALAVLALLYGSASHQVSSKESEASRLEEQAQTAQQQASGLAQYKSFVALRDAREQAIVGLINSRFDWAHSLNEIGRVLPPGSTVNSLQGAAGTTGKTGSSSSSSSSSAKASAGTVASATPAGTTPTLTITGCATSQSTVALLLNRLRLMDGVSNVELHSSVKTVSTSSGTPNTFSATSCPSHDPLYQVQVTFAPLPTGPNKSAAPASQKPAAPSSGSAVNAADTKAKATG